MWAPARTSPVALISGFSCGWLRSRPTDLAGPAVSARIRNVSVPAAAAAAARSAASDVSSAAPPGGATAAGLRPSAARKLSSCALSARTWAARESIWRGVGCCAEPALGRATSPASAAMTAYRCRLIVERLLFQRSTAGDRAPGAGAGGRRFPRGGGGGPPVCYSLGRGGARGGGGRGGGGRPGGGAMRAYRCRLIVERPLSHRPRAGARAPGGGGGGGGSRGGGGGGPPVCYSLELGGARGGELRRVKRGAGATAGGGPLRSGGAAGGANVPARCGCTRAIAEGDSAQRRALCSAREPAAGPAPHLGRA